MTDRVRNITVGLTILIALVVFMYGIFLLGKGPHLSTAHQYPVMLITPNANGVATGDKVLLAGIQVGQVESADLATNTATGAMEAHLGLLINQDVNLPGNTIASITRSATGVGTPTVDLTAEGTPAAGAPATSAPAALAKDGSAKIIVTSVETNPLAGLIPQSVFDDIHALKQNLGGAANGLTTVSQDLHILLAYTPPEMLENIPPGEKNPPHENASTAIIRLDRTIAGLQKLVDDPVLQDHVRQAVANIDAASAQFKTTLDKIQTLANNANGAIGSISGAADSIKGAATRASDFLGDAQRDFDHVSAQLVATLGGLDKTLNEIADGKGTTGKLVNDPRLYEGLVDLSASLKKTSEDLDSLVKKWEAEGMGVHL